MNEIPLTLAISRYDHVEDLTSGRIMPEGVRLTCLSLPIEEIFFRFLKHREWDVSELSFAKYASLISQGDTSLTAIPVFLIHLPLAFETNGCQGTSWRDAFITWGVLLVAAPFQRYLIGTLLIDTRGSTLAAGLMHASINAAGAMVIVPGGWQVVPALILLTLGVLGYRSWRGRSAIDGYAPAITPASEAAQRTALGVMPQPRSPRL